MRALLGLAMSTVLAVTLTQAAAAEPDRPDGTTITLLTGDAVTLSGESVAVRRAPGRERIPVTTYRDDGHVYVVPADAGRLIATDRLDRRLFDVTELVRLGYHDDATIPVITGGRPGKARKGADLRPADKVWLDGRRMASLDQTVPRIGAPAAWQAGLTGAGVTVAVLDTGIDQTHPDLAGKEVAERNFSDAPDNVDRIGHGTHVASIIASTGTPYHGVAAGARLLDAKVFDDDGWAYDSDIIASLRWAADQGATIANLSLGTGDTPGTDPVEAVVDELAASHGLLVVAAAGNEYMSERIGSPASADSALAVGAVDKSDAMALFSSRGPRLGDGAVKPELVAPGVDVTAALAGGGHVSMSGTSMAAPHVSGAAALLAQAHPDWSGQRLKAALVGSAAPIAGTEYDRGAGRVDVARAITQSVTADPVNFGALAWPHTDAAEHPVTYRNDGPVDVALALSVTGPFQVAHQLTVPAGGTATVSVSVPGSTEDGAKSGLLTATAQDIRVVTPVGVLHEPKMHTLTVDMVGPDGAPTADYSFHIASLDRQWADFAYDPDGRVTLRLPEGHYLIDTSISAGDRVSALTAPDLPLTADRVLTFDARTARPVRITPPVPANLVMLDHGVATYRPGTRPFFFSTAYGDSQISTGHVGPVPPKEVSTNWLNTQWTAGAEFYGLAWFWDGRVPTGIVKRVDRVATVRVDLPTPGDRSAIPAPHGGFAPAFGGDVAMSHALPVEGGERIEHYNEQAQWSTRFDTDQVRLRSPSRVYQAGRTYRERFGGAVYGPVLPPTAYPTPGVSRTGDDLWVDVPLFGDAAGNAGYATRADTHLYRDGVEVPYEGAFPLPPEAADYRLTMSATRDAKVSTTVDVAWTFRSGHVDGTARVPVSVLRFSPRLDGDTAPHGRFLVPVTLRRADGTHARPRHLTVDVSYDDGVTWQRATTIGNLVIDLTHPVTARSVSLRARAEDGGATVEQTIISAYLLR